MRLYLSLFRVLIPSWKFFDDFGQGFQPQFRFGQNSQNLGEWQPFLASEPRRLHHLFLNARGNERLLTASTFERLISESQDYLDTPNAFLNTATYKIGERLVREQIPQTASHFQFRIVGMNSEDVFVSKVIDL